MNRRVFLARLGFGTVTAAAAALTFDVEKLLWVPGRKRIIEVSKPTIAMRVALTDREYDIQLTRLKMYCTPNPEVVMSHCAYIIDNPPSLIHVS